MLQCYYTMISIVSSKHELKYYLPRRTLMITDRKDVW